jgi:outer membrane lipoprotein-sorting protein
MHRLLQFLALRAVKLRFSAVAVAKLKFCNSLYSLLIANSPAPKQQPPLSLRDASNRNVTESSLAFYVPLGYNKTIMNRKLYAGRRGICLFAALVWGLCSLPAQEIITAERYLEMVAERYSSVKDYEAALAIISGGSEMAGNVSHLAPSFLRIDFTRPAEQVIVFNGELLTVYLPEYRVVLNQAITQSRRSASSAASLASAQGLTLLRRNYVPSFVIGPAPSPLEGNSTERVVKLRLTRRSLSEGFREIVLSVNPETLLIRRIEGRTIADGQVRFDFTNVKINQGIPEQRFIYDSPASANLRNNFLFQDAD